MWKVHLRRFKYRWLRGLRAYYRALLWRINLKKGVVIASYPKSGNTYLRLLLADYFQVNENSTDLDSLEKQVPYVGTRVSEIGYYKSHETACCHLGDKVIFVHRKPSEVFESLRRSLKRRGLEYDSDKMIKDFTTGVIAGYSGYLEYLSKWFELSEKSNLIKLVSYNELIEDPLTTLKALIPELDIECAEIAIKNNSVKKVREKEKSSTFLMKQGITDVGSIAGNGDYLRSCSADLSELDKEYEKMVLKLK